MSNELHVLKYLDKGLKMKEIFYLIHFSSERFAKRGSLGRGAYSYSVKNQWQGKHKDLLVIGDRKAGATSTEILKKPALLKKLKASININEKFIHIIRNPFDTITTTFKKTYRRPNEEPIAHLKREIG